MSSLALGFVAERDAGARVHHGRLFHDEAVLVELANVAARISQGNFVDFVGIQPHLALAAF